jgi:glycerol-3-phosphate acyltransferase PlsX
VRGVVIKGHGSSDANAIKNAIRQAASAIKNRLVEELTKEFSGK